LAVRSRTRRFQCIRIDRGIGKTLGFFASTIAWVSFDWLRNAAGCIIWFGTASLNASGIPINSQTPKQDIRKRRGSNLSLLEFVDRGLSPSAVAACLCGTLRRMIDCWEFTPR
jgi:hypothetical protein